MVSADSLRRPDRSVISTWSLTAHKPNSWRATKTVVPILRISELHKSFGALEVLKGISLEVIPGEVVSIIGASGSGKSTFLRCINMMEMPDRGVMEFQSPFIFTSTPVPLAPRPQPCQRFGPRSVWYFRAIIYGLT